MKKLNERLVELIKAGDELEEAVDTLKIRMSCQFCEGDGCGWLCAGCESAYAAAERAQDAWYIAKANDK